MYLVSVGVLILVSVGVSWCAARHPCVLVSVGVLMLVSVGVLQENWCQLVCCVAIWCQLVCSCWCQLVCVKKIGVCWCQLVCCVAIWCQLVYTK